MRIGLVTVLALISVCASIAVVSGQGVKVTLSVEGAAVVDVASKIGEQTDIQVGVAGKSDALVTLEIQDAAVEEAVAAVAESFDGSWMRAYIVESKSPAKTYTADELVAMMTKMRDDWTESMTEEQRQAQRDQWRAAWQAQREQAAAEMQGQPGQGRGRGLYDPIRRLIFPERVETISLQLTDVPLTQALYGVMAASGYIVLAENELTGTLSLNVENAPIADVLTQIAQAVEGKWRPFYLMSQPRELSDEERTEMRENARDSRWARFWEKDPEERATDIQRRVERIERWAERARRPAEGDQPRRARRGRGLQRRGPRMLQRLGQYSANLTPEQRLEIKPLMKALGAALKQ